MRTPSWPGVGPTFLRILAACSVGLTTVHCASDKAPRSGSKAAAAATVPTLQTAKGQDDADLELSSGDEITALGRLADGTTLVTTRDGLGFRMLDDEVTSVAPKQRSVGSVQAFPVSDDVIWFFYPDDSLVGRSKGGNASKLEVNKAAFDEVVSDPSSLTPVAVTEQCIYWVTSKELVVFTFKGDKLNLKAIPLPGGKLEADEPVLGAGALDGSEDGVWLITDRRVAALAKPSAGAKWTVKPLALEKEKKAPRRIAASVSIDKGAIVLGDDIVALFGEYTLRHLSAADQKKK